MTETEAKTKWCAMVRFYENSQCGPTNNRNAPADNNQSHLCIGSACMMWQWRRAKGVALTDSGFGSEGDGYCGLAGKP